MPRNSSVAPMKLESESQIRSSRPTWEIEEDIEIKETEIEMAQVVNIVPGRTAGPGVPDDEEGWGSNSALQDWDEEEDLNIRSTAASGVGTSTTTLYYTIIFVLMKIPYKFVGLALATFNGIAFYSIPDPEAESPCFLRHTQLKVYWILSAVVLVYWWFFGLWCKILFLSPSFIKKWLTLPCSIFNTMYAASGFTFWVIYTQTTPEADACKDTGAAGAALVTFLWINVGLTALFAMLPALFVVGLFIWRNVLGDKPYGSLPAVDVFPTDIPDDLLPIEEDDLSEDPSALEGYPIRLFCCGPPRSVVKAQKEAQAQHAKDQLAYKIAQREEEEEEGIPRDSWKQDGRDRPGSDLLPLF